MQVAVYFNKYNAGKVVFDQVESKQEEKEDTVEVAKEVLNDSESTVNDLNLDNIPF
jgi:hypothetical protein